MPKAMIDLLISLLFFGITAVVLYGWGGLLTGLFHIRLPKVEGFFSQLWIGWAIVLLVLRLRGKTLQQGFAILTKEDVIYVKAN